MKNLTYFLLSYLDITKEDGVNFLLKFSFVLKLLGGFIIVMVLLPNTFAPITVLWFGLGLVALGLIPSAMTRWAKNIRGIDLIVEEIGIPFAFVYALYLLLSLALIVFG